MPAGGALVAASLLAATTERGGLAACVSAPSREIGLDAREVALVFEESFIAGASVETTETGADAGADSDAVAAGSVGGSAATSPEDALLVPTVTVSGESEALPSAGAPADEEDGGDEPTVTVPGDPEPFPSAGAPADEEGGGVGFVATGIGLSEESSCPEDEPPGEEEPWVSPEEGEGGGLFAPPSLPPSSDLLAEPESSPSTEAPPDEGGTVAGGVVADVLSEASSSPDDRWGVEGEALVGAGDDTADVLSSSVELPLVFGLSSERVSAVEPSVVEFAGASDDGAPEGLILVPDDAVAGESFSSPP
jgi:hypothetical protein